MLVNKNNTGNNKITNFILKIKTNTIQIKFKILLVLFVIVTIMFLLLVKMRWILSDNLYKFYAWTHGDLCLMFFGYVLFS